MTPAPEEVTTSIPTNNVLNLTVDETLLLSKALHFCPCRHFDLFDTILDVNSVVRNLSHRKHYHIVDNIDNLGDNVSEALDVGSDCLEYTFRELCAMRDLEDLSHEGSITSVSVAGDDKFKSVKYKIRSDF